MIWEKYCDLKYFFGFAKYFWIVPSRLPYFQLPRETEDNAYAKFWDDKQRVLWYVMVFSGVVNWTRLSLHAAYLSLWLLLFNNSHSLLLLQKWPFWKGWAVINCIQCNGIFKCTDRPFIFYLFFSDEQGPFFQSVVLEILREWQSNQKGLPSPKSDEEKSSPTSSPDSALPPSLATNDGTSITTQGLLPRKRIDSLGWGTPPMDYKGNRNRFPCLHSLI